MGEASPEKKEEEEDLRLTFMFEYLQKTMRLKQERWTKMLATEELEKILMDFLNGRVADEVLVMTLNPAGQLIPVLGFPASIRNKAVYFIKRDKETITGENFRRRLVFGDMAPKPVDELATLVEEVFVPLLSNPMNHKGWPKVAADDVIKHVHELKNAVYEVQGKISGQTMLPMPIGVERVYQVEQDLVDSNGEKIDLQMKSDIEAIVIKWVSQVNDVLQEDSVTPLDEDPFPTPLSEVKFWNDRVKNLQCVYTQLREPRASKFLDPSALLEGDVDECRDSVLLCLKYLETFRLMFEEYRAKLPTMFKEGHEPVPWTFHPKMAFGRMFLFVERLKKIDVSRRLNTRFIGYTRLPGLAFFACAQEFLRLEKVEFGGIKGRALTSQIVSVFQSLQRLLSPHPLAYSTTTQSFPLSSTFHCTPLRHLPLVLHLGFLTLNLISSILFGIVSSHDRTTVLRLASVSADVR
uniref:Dynein heavy chain tail domain-containing protein n=1 Tax=Timema tahoe TaxID=61484 RepID=A0A7R9FH41_9NEOP|nr:unnamed protein product [Timema tahoe]